MRTITITERIGERIGDIDYSYNFASHFESYCTSPEQWKEICARRVELLREVEAAHKEGKQVMVDLNNYWHRVIDIGMYDGWPYWKPTPALYVDGTLGGEWHFFNDLHQWKVK